MIQMLMDKVRRLATKTALLLARGVLRQTDDAGPLQKATATLLASEGREMERFQDYGVSSNPPSGADTLSVFLGGNREHGILIKADHRAHRPKDLLVGEVIVYDDRGQTVKLQNNKIIITSPRRVDIVAPEVVIDSPHCQFGRGAESDLRAVARVGDVVRVSRGSSSGDWPIITGSDQSRIH